ncbi:hypothetical protein OEZ86_010754 [Tetradesmus obliquus]|nr:hypothetical protein OEZ86_010754 [Tetradesmus obliquus]
MLLYACGLGVVSHDQFEVARLQPQHVPGLGALLGAAYGVDGVPQEWRAKVTGWPEMEAAIDAVVVVAGCSRSVYLGALLGAAYGVDGLPQEWRAKVTGWQDMEAAIDAVVV